MKKILNFILLLCAAFLCKIYAQAVCDVNLACSIADLEQKAHSYDIETIHKIHQYFAKTVNEDLFFNKKNDKISYNDLFIFNTIV